MAALSGVVERVKGVFTMADDVPIHRQAVGALGIAGFGVLFAHVAAPDQVGDWFHAVAYSFAGVFAATYFFRGFAALSWSLGLCLVWAEELVSMAMWEASKFLSFVGLVLIACVSGAEAANVQAVFNLPVPAVTSLPNWLAEFWATPAFLTFVGLTFVLYRACVWVWRYRPEGPEQWTSSQSS